MWATRRVQAFGLFLVAAGLTAAMVPVRSASVPSLEALGKALFSDTNLSHNRTVSCATCHDPAFGFADPRENGFDPPVGRAVSRGDDGKSIGDRNAPALGYAQFSPAFHLREDGEYVGGQFWDGRAATLEEQAGKPLLDPGEMGMENEGAVVRRLMENADYVAAFQAHFGDDVFDDPNLAVEALTEAIGAFERSAELAPFDSRYDRYLRGEVALTELEEAGRKLFFAEGLVNCNQCHQLHEHSDATAETFTGYAFHNVGTPVNTAVRKANESEDAADLGLLAHTDVNDPAQAGKFKVPTLRNVAVTGPYMHNGMFQDLRTVVVFYNQYTSKDPSVKINPETGKPWARTEFKKTLSLDELSDGLPLDDGQVDALVAFLKALTDQRYEHLLTE
ncbi:MAG: cytochrome c peroxidase [Pseudomonadota bacterium]